MRWKSKRNCSRLIKVLNVLGAGSVRIQPDLANNNGKQTRSCEKIYIGEGGTVKREPLLFIFSVYITTMLADLRRMFLPQLKRLFTYMLETGIASVF